MSYVKTAISLEPTVFEQTAVIARELNISRSRVIAMAVEEFIERRRNKQLLEQINAAYADFPDPDEQILQKKIRQKQRLLIKKGDQW